MGIVKFDLLGLGMLSVLHYAIDFIRDTDGVEVDLATLPQESEVYDMLQKADTIGVFQIESRAQMATLPRLKPRCFYDLVARRHDRDDRHPGYHRPYASTREARKMSRRELDTGRYDHVT